MEKKFKFVVIDNETGDVKAEYDTDCIVGGIATETGTTSIGMTSCDHETLAKTIASAEKVIEALKEDNPLVMLLSGFFKATMETVETDFDDDE